MSAANRRRGHDAERAVAKYLRDNGWPDACTTREKLGHDGATAPGDIDFHTLVTLEVKDVASSAWPSWCRQALAGSRPGMIPMVVRRTRGVPHVGLWECRFRAVAWQQVTDHAPIVIRAGHFVDVDPLGTYWYSTTFAAFTDALARFDATDGVTRPC